MLSAMSSAETVSAGVVSAGVVSAGVVSAGVVVSGAGVLVLPPPQAARENTRAPARTRAESFFKFFKLIYLPFKVNARVDVDIFKKMVRPSEHGLLYRTFYQSATEISRLSKKVYGIVTKVLNLLV